METSNPILMVQKYKNMSNVTLLWNFFSLILYKKQTIAVSD